MGKGKILIVDDTATYRTILSDALAAKGYEILQASNGLDAIKTVRQEMKSIDLMMLDLLMPKMLGFEVMREIRHMEGGADFPIMVVTGLFKSPDDIKQVRNLGAVGFLDKALKIEDIVKRVEGFMHPEWEEDVIHQVEAQLYVNYKVGEKAFSDLSHSVGPSGMFIKTEVTHPPGASVSARFRLTDEGDTIETKGKIILIVTEHACIGTRKLPHGFEIHFTEISAEHKNQIESFVEGRAKSEGSRVADR